jgi:PAS domain S-box-containing protein
MSRKASHRTQETPPATVRRGRNGARPKPLAWESAALVELSASRALAEGDVGAFLREVTVAAARFVEVARVGVWLLDESGERLTCELLYDRAAGSHSDGVVFLASEHRRYFAALETARVLDATDASEDPRTNEFASHYLAPNGIAAMLDAPIRVGGRVVGVVCHEHLGGPRSWNDTEQRFAASVADLVALALERAGRTHAEDSLRQSMERYRTLVESVRDAIFTLDRQGCIESLNLAFEQILGFSREEWIGKHFAPLLHPDDLPAAADRMRRVLSGESPPPYELRIRTAQGDFKVGEFQPTPRWDRGEVIGVLGVARDVSERKRTEAANRALLDLARETAGALDLDELLRSVLERTADAVPADLVIISREDPVTGLVRVIAHRGVPEDALPAVLALRFTPGSTFGGRVYGGETIVMNEPPDGSIAAASVGLETMGVTALLVAPLRFGSHSFGALVVGRRGGSGLSPAQVELCEAIARQVAGAIEVAELYREKEEEARVAAALARVGQEMISTLDAPVLVERFCRVTREVLDADISHTFLYDEASQEFVPIAGVGETAVPWSALQAIRVPRVSVAESFARLESQDVLRLAAGEGAGTAIDHLMADYGIVTGMLMALRRGNEVVGVQSVGLKSAGAVFSPAQERIARGIAHIASLALENARLFEQLESASRLKSDFVATISHELRTPLNVILGYASLLAEGAFGPLLEAQADAVRRLERSGKALFDLVSATLDLSRLEAGRIQVDDEDLDVSALSLEIVREATEESQRRGLALETRIEGPPRRVRTDRGKLKLVLGNLVANALKFTEHGKIVLACEDRDDGVEFRIDDTGPGIPESQREMIFEPFRQGDASPSRRHGGAGLGLYIVRRVLDLLGGWVHLESQVGLGTTFRVWVPRRRSGS